jgi:hypothetical protein
VYKKTTIAKLVLGVFLVYFKTQKIEEKHKNLEMMLKVDFFPCPS